MSFRQSVWPVVLYVFTVLALLIAGVVYGAQRMNNPEKDTARAWEELDMHLFFAGFEAVSCPRLPGWAIEGGTCHATHADAAVALRRLATLNYATGHLSVEGTPQQSGDLVRGRAVAWLRSRDLFSPSQVAFEIDYAGLSFTSGAPGPGDAGQVLRERGLVSVIRIGETPAHHQFPLQRLWQDQSLFAPEVQQQHRRERYHANTSLHWASLGDLGLAEVDCPGLPGAEAAAACFVFPPGRPLPTDLNVAMAAWAADARRYTTQGDRQPHAPPPPPLRLWQGGGFTGMAQTLPLRLFSGGPLDRELPDLEHDYAVRLLAKSGAGGGEIPADFREAAGWLAGQEFPGYLVVQSPVPGLQ